MFDFVDLFAGVGGFHSALKGLGGNAVQAVEIDPLPAEVYELNWDLKPDSDIRDLSPDAAERVRDHSVLAGGFPCQPFSKSGRQRGIAEERGTLFHDILAILEAKTPPVVMLENVRNIAGPRQRDAWTAIIAGLRRAGYKVSDSPCVFSPHLLSPAAGGAAQVRERVYILGVFVGRERAEAEVLATPPVEHRPQSGWDPDRWSIREHVLLPEPADDMRPAYALTTDETMWIDTWNELLARLGPDVKLPGIPLWEYTWRAKMPALGGLPSWKQSFIRTNHAFYLQNRRAIDAWRAAPREVGIVKFPASRRKFEWQAQNAERDLWRLLIQLRPSGIRVKRPTYTPALVAMNQTPIYGPKRRRLTPLETARLQGFDPRIFSFGQQLDGASYKQMGNAVNVGAVRHVFREFVLQNVDDIASNGAAGLAIVDAVLGSVAALTGTISEVESVPKASDELRSNVSVDLDRLTHLGT